MFLNGDPCPLMLCEILSVAQRFASINRARVLFQRGYEGMIARITVSDDCLMFVIVCYKQNRPLIGSTTKNRITHLTLTIVSLPK